MIDVASSMSVPAGLSVGASATLAVAIAFLLDAIIEEPPEGLHPVVWFGTVVATVDREWARPGLVGALALGLPLAGAAAVWAVVHITPGPADAVVAGIALFVTLSRRLLLSEARAVIADSESDLVAARERLPALAGRDSEPLAAEELRSAAVESAAENLADGLVAPLVAFAIGALVSLPIAAAAAAWVKGVNTLDSMLGYRSKAVGGPSARLDDLVMAVPARVSAVLIAAVSLDPGAVRRASRWAKAPPSPNSGWPMATLSAVADVRLEKPGSYVLNPAAAFPDVDRGLEGVRIVDRAAIAAFLLSGGWVLGLGGVLG
ncbi:adenosylcobinamide-phosphate synthase [Halalkaliarchaeum desulfuricum]|uniref:Probable cobalamin biosynthesis protein CobD n=1 Tax=Halalkaliarchaeum desulfuricum TaxID=2055893 RepID=A0A343TL50_9EURY|nr:CobD/CbiB family cobalamin biosynthesis protein [Halalkaliarchaeum desulfuricum]AUX09822.1 adenosylcobinamide-phosphate synthase [Halalkaliarchaeum desulfuricum]